MLTIMNVRNSNILVTADCGLFGSIIIDLLLRDYSDASIIILDNFILRVTNNIDDFRKDSSVTIPTVQQCLGN